MLNSNNSLHLFQLTRPTYDLFVMLVHDNHNMLIKASCDIIIKIMINKVILTTWILKSHFEFEFESSLMIFKDLFYL